MRLIALRLQMGNPNSAIDGADADRAITLRKDLTGRASKAILCASAEKEAVYVQQLA